MPEIGEIIAFEVEINKSDFCYQAQDVGENPGWSVVIDGIKGKGDPSILASNLVKIGEKKPKKPAKKLYGWDLKKCNTTTFPWQAHHLVPEKLLPKHNITVFLAVKSKKKHKKYVLEFDTNYDTNDGLNGRFMPFASTTHQWLEAGTSAAKKKKICYKMMKLTQRQLHQGPHSNTDYSEDPNAESSGYKTAVKKLLKIIYKATLNHVDNCDDCKGKKKGSKTKIRPLESSVEHVHQASAILENLIIDDKIWVSRRAAMFYAEEGY